MAKPQARYACQQCGTIAPKWTGRCEACGAWNSLVEEVPRPGPPKSLGQSSGRRGGSALDFVALRGETAGPPRLHTGIAELDRVCGGGVVPGSTILVGGDPGIGKSTLLLQAAAALAAGGASAAYITGEEAIDQIRLRAARLGVAGSPVRLAAASSVRDIAAALDDARAPDLVVIDSIQTMYLDTLDSAPGTVSQVRGAAQEL
ncbi:MAG TPA: AAA family ATPase, partial [Stellaceae bacterium]